MMFRSYARLALVPTTLVAGCPGDDTSATASADSTGSSESSSDATVTQTTTQTTTMSTTEADSSSSTSEESSTTDVTQGSSESSSSESSSSGSSEESSTTEVDLCGNGSIDGSEQCDGEDLNGSDCTDVGFDAGTLACNAGCVYDTFNCIIYICGNDTIDPTEFCDGAALGGGDCASEGFPLGGELACNGACDGYDTSGCLTQLCGNDTIEGTEVCDGTALAGDTCAAHGLAGGNLGCNASCTGVTYTSCSAPNAQFTYIANDTSPNSVTGYAIDSDGLLTEIPGSPFATGGNSGFDHHPDAIANCGAFVYAVNFASDSITGFFVEANGALTPIAGSPFALDDALSLACDGDHLYATTFQDVVHRFTIETDGSLTALGTVSASPSALGLSIDDESQRLFVAGYDLAQNVFDIDAAGNLTAVPGSPFLHTGSNHSSVVSPDGAFVASEGVAGVRIWSVAGNGALTEVAGSPFADSSGCDVVGLAWAPDSARVFVGHRNCSPGVVSVYDVAGNGALTQVVGSPFATGDDSAVSIAVDPSGSRIFVTHGDGTGVSVLDVSDSGALTPVAGSPFANSVPGTHATIVLRGGSQLENNCVFNTAFLPVNVHPSNYYGDFDFDGECNLVVSGCFNGTLVEVDGLTGAVTTLVDTFGMAGSINGVAHRASDGLTYVATDEPPMLYSADPLGTAVHILDFPTTMNAIAVAPPGYGSNGNLLFSVGVDSNVYAIDPLSASASIFAGPLGGILSDLEFDPTTNTLYVLDNGGPIYSIDQDGNVSDFAGGFFSPDGLAINPGVELYVADFSSGGGAITAVDLADASTSFVANASFDGGYYVTGMMRDAAGTLLMKVSGANIDYVTP
ncbi:MAG TPA: hypothetical protein VG755_16090 [Nannocystaceae bacterium]|nr:hypothetical protein [Nannocystaceae bacterium]